MRLNVNSNYEEKGKGSRKQINVMGIPLTVDGKISENVEPNHGYR